MATSNVLKHWNSNIYELHPISIRFHMISHIRVLGLEHRIQSVRFKETTQLKISLFSFESIKIIFLENTHTYCTINVHVIRLFKNVLYKLKCWINLIIVKHNYLLLIVQAHIYQELDVNLVVFIIIQIFILWCKKELQNTMQIYDIFITANLYFTSTKEVKKRIAIHI